MNNISNISIKKEIKKLQERINFLNNQIKSNNEYIRKNCNHEWIRDIDNYSYDERPFICKNCKMTK